MKCLSVDERVEIGRRARREVPRSTHSQWTAAADRTDPLTLLERQAITRVPELVPIRYGRMLTSPFAFYRGSAIVMASDLANTPRSGLTAQICGDAHLANFGAYAAPDRRLVFDINDFDETLPGPWEWDVKRLATSFEIAGRHIGLKGSERRAAVLNSVSSYRTAMLQFAEMRTLDVWYSRLEIEDRVAQLRKQLGASFVKRTERQLDKARTKDSLRALSKLTHLVDGEPRFDSAPPLLVPAADIFAEAGREDLLGSLGELIRLYRGSLPNDRKLLAESFRFVDLARKVVGVGSVGTRTWALLMIGRDNDDPLFLQVKQAESSVLEEYLGKAKARNHGQRVVEGQRLMQAASDIMLGWVRATGIDGEVRDYYVRQLWDGKASADIDNMGGLALAIYGELCGWTLARAHARSGDRIAIPAYLGTGSQFDSAVAEFAEAYANQNEADYAAFQAAVDSGRLKAETGI